ncbi:6939_t:CDS:2, partial [Racocetra fulgida]
GSLHSAFIARLDENRQQLVNAGAIPVLVSLLNSPDTDVQYYCTTALSNIAVDEKYQLEIVRSRGLPPLLRLLQSSFLPLILSSVACIRNISIHPLNESPIIDAGFLSPLIQLLAYEENEEIQCHAISTLRNLAASAERNKRAIVDAGAVERIRELVLNVPISVQSEMTACVAVLALSVQDYSPFVKVWEQPTGGLHGYLQRFLDSTDKTFQHIAVWTIVQFLEGRDSQLFTNIKSSNTIVSAINRLAEYSVTPDGEEPLDEEYESDEGEIVALARKTLAMLQR